MKINNINSVLNIMDENADSLHDIGLATDVLDAFNNAISGLYRLSDRQSVFDSANSNVDTIKQYRAIEKEIGIQLHEIASKIRLMRNLIFAESIDWCKVSAELKSLEE